MAYEFRITRRVEFSETDMAGILYYANLFRYMESAESAFFRSLGHSVAMNDFDPPLGIPRVHAECDYFKPLKFEDNVEVRLLVTQLKDQALSYLFVFRKLNVEPPVEVARGRVTVVCVAHNPDGSMKAVSFPKELIDLIEVAPVQLQG